MSATTNPTSTPMSVKERLFHAVAFEIGAILVAMILVIAFADIKMSSALFVSVIMALMAMAWNFVFNLGFDKLFTAPRETRGLGLRIFHTISFEMGLLIFTIPVLAWVLGLSLWQAFLADVGLTIAITVYALIFNWIYDIGRLKFIKVKVSV